jgi:hypothetical protein
MERMKFLETLVYFEMSEKHSTYGEKVNAGKITVRKQAT